MATKLKILAFDFPVAKAGSAVPRVQPFSGESSRWLDLQPDLFEYLKLKYTKKFRDGTFEGSISRLLVYTELSMALARSELRGVYANNVDKLLQFKVTYGIFKRITTI